MTCTGGAAEGRVTARPAWSSPPCPYFGRCGFGGVSLPFSTCPSSLWSLTEKVAGTGCPCRAPSACRLGLSPCRSPARVPTDGTEGHRALGDTQVGRPSQAGTGRGCWAGTHLCRGHTSLQWGLSWFLFLRTLCLSSVSISSVEDIAPHPSGAPACHLRPYGLGPTPAPPWVSSSVC